MNNISFAAKAWIILGLALSTLALTIGISWALLQDAILHERKAMLVDIVEMAHGIIAKQHARQLSGELTEKEAQKAAIETLRPFRYGKNGYVFIYKGSVAMLAPENPANEGRDLGNVQDPNGIYIGREMTRITANGGAGFLSYHWTRPETPNKPAEKLSYAKGFEPWGWYVGSGIYQDDLHEILSSLLHRKLGMLLITAAVLVVAVGVGTMVTASSVRRLVTFQRKLERIGKGDFTENITPDGKDELGQMMTSLKSVQQHFREVIEQLNDIADSVLEGVSGIAHSNSNLSRHISTQASELAGIDDTLRQIAAITDECEQAVARATTTASESEASIGRGEEVVSRAVASMERITTSSERVTDIIGVIDDLAFQTNLLALNAAVEAARAGEQGKGFAVVANEVRNLAQRSADAARQIRELIEESSQNVRIGTDLVNQSGALLREIVKNYSEVTTLLTEVSEASSRQTRDIARTSTQLNKLNRYSQKNLTLVESASAASEQVRDNAERMRRQLSFFRLPDADTRHDARPPAARKEATDDGQTAGAKAA